MFHVGTAGIETSEAAEFLLIHQLHLTAPEFFHTTAHLVRHGVTDEAVADANVEINVWQWLDAEVVASHIRLDLGCELEEQAQFTDFHRLFHYVHGVEIIKDDGFQDKVAPVGVHVHAGK